MTKVVPTGKLLGKRLNLWRDKGMAPLRVRTVCATPAIQRRFRKFSVRTTNAVNSCGYFAQTSRLAGFGGTCYKVANARRIKAMNEAINAP